MHLRRDTSSTQVSTSPVQTPNVNKTLLPPKETYVLPKEPDIPLKGPIFCQKSPSSHQKSPVQTPNVNKALPPTK